MASNSTKPILSPESIVPRSLAHRILMRVEEGAFSHVLVDSELEASALEEADRRLASRLVYGTLAWQRTLDRHIERFSDRPVSSIDRDARWALRLAAYQTSLLDRIPPHAIVDESVKLVEGTNPRATGFVNAVARRLTEASLRPEDAPDPADRQKKPVRWLGDRYSMPNWLANRMLQKHGGVDRAAPHLEAMNREPPIWLYSKSEVAQTEPHPSLPNATRADRFHDEARAAVEAGEAIVQDLGAQLVCALCGPVDDRTVLDACAGLGGKSLNLMTRGATMSLVEPHAAKLERFQTSPFLKTLSEPKLFVGTLQEYDSADRYDVVLVDAPCTALGVLRRHPEARWTRTKKDIQSCAAVQSDLLNAAKQWVKPGGVLVYAVCTFTREETHDQVSSFLESSPEFSADGAPEGDFDWSPYLDESGALSVSPYEHDADGFFAFRFKHTGDT